MTTPEADMPPPDAATLMRMIDFRIPLPWLLGGFIAAVGVLTSMWFEQRRTTETLVQVQIELKAGNSAYATLTGEVALLKFRVEGLEADRRAGQSPARPPR